jgi:hypothetical protein
MMGTSLDNEIKTQFNLNEKEMGWLEKFLKIHNVEEALEEIWKVSKAVFGILEWMNENPSKRRDLMEYPPETSTETFEVIMKSMDELIY